MASWYRNWDKNPYVVGGLAAKCILFFPLFSPEIQEFKAHMKRKVHVRFHGYGAPLKVPLPLSQFTKHLQRQHDFEVVGYFCKIREVKIIHFSHQPKTGITFAGDHLHNGQLLGFIFYKGNISMFFQDTHTMQSSHTFAYSLQT